MVRMRIYARIEGVAFFLQKIPAATFKALQQSNLDFIALGYDAETGIYTVASPSEIRRILKDTLFTVDDELKAYTPGEDYVQSIARSADNWPSSFLDDEEDEITQDIPVIRPTIPAPPGDPEPEK